MDAKTAESIKAALWEIADELKALRDLIARIEYERVKKTGGGN